MDAREKNIAVRNAVIPQLIKLQEAGVDAMDVNMALLGLVTRSMEQCVGKHQARELIEAGMNNVWGKK